MSFKKDPIFGLKVFDSTKRLILANFIMAVISITIGGIAAFFIATARSGIEGLVSGLGISASNYYLFLTLHGMNMLIFWILWAEIAILYFVSSVVLNTEIYKRLAWLAFALMFSGQLTIEAMILSDQASVLFTAYPPLVAALPFYIGYIFFALGAGIGVLVFFLTIYRARIEGNYQGSLPLVTWGAAIAAIIAVTVVVHGAITLIYTLLWNIGVVPLNVMFYRWFFWGLGHDAQYVNVSATVAVLYALVSLGTGLFAVKFFNERYAKLAFALYAFFVVPGIGHHILVDPGFSMILKQASGSVGSHFLSVPTLLHAFALSAAIEASLRATGHTSLLGWIRRIPWKNPAISATVFSLIMLGIAGIVAQPQTTLQPNLNYHNTLWVPGHFHFAVAGSTTIAFMALAYYVVPLLTSKKLYSTKLAKIQIFTFFIGITILSLSMLIRGFYGEPRRTFMDSSLMLSEWISASPFLLLGAIIAIAGGIMFVFNVLATLLWGKETNKVEELISGLVSKMEEKQGAVIHKKGAFVLCIIIVLILLALYFYSFARLSLMPSLF